jgi:hypothetical protein
MVSSCAYPRPAPAGPRRHGADVDACPEAIRLQILYALQQEPDIDWLGLEIGPAREGQQEDPCITAVSLS